MADDNDLRQDLLWRIENRRRAVQAFLRDSRPRIRRRMTLTVVLSSLAALFTAGPAFGGETFSESVQGAFGMRSDSTVWRVLCLLALLVSVGAAVLTNLGKSMDDVGRISNAEAVNTELEGLAGLLQFGQLTVEDGVKLYQQYSAKIPFVDDGPAETPGSYARPGPGPGYYAPPGPGSGYSTPPKGPRYPAPPPQPGSYPPRPPHG